MKKERRDFLKITAAGATGLALTRATPARAAWPSSGTMDINPDISNMRVVACVDTAMMKSVPATMTFETQNAAVDYARVQANMDAMAMSLTQKGTADDAWTTIFRSSKDWASSTVAIKVNGGEGKNTAHLAILQKLSNLFIGWGVKPTNFIVYDGHTSPGAPGIFSASFSATDKSKVLGVVGGPSGSSGDLLGGWKDGKLVDGTTRRCAAKIVDGTVDVLINIANNKGHAYGTVLGNVTLCMKNHYGTWEPDSTHTDLANLIFKMNKSDPIIGGTPPRQQLCIVDSLFCNKVDITGTPELMPCYLVMGTFAPAIDYQTVKKIREAVSNIKTDDTKIEPYLTSFGYTASDVQWILVPPASASTADASPPGSGGSGGGGKLGSGGANAGGSSGSGDANSDGSRGSGGANTGGSSGSGGAGAGKGSGGANAGGANGSGGANAGGSKGSGGANAGGTSGPGGMASGGSVGVGGTMASGSGGSGGTLASSTSGAGGVATSGGTSGGATPSANSGCGCDVGGAGLGTRGLSASLVVATLIAGQVRRLFLRREKLAVPTATPKESAAEIPISVAPEDDEPDPKA